LFASLGYNALADLHKNQKRHADEVQPAHHRADHDFPRVNQKFAGI
jgi:hypothetical protein